MIEQGPGIVGEVVDREMLLAELGLAGVAPIVGDELEPIGRQDAGHFGRHDLHGFVGTGRRSWKAYCAADVG